MCLDQRGRRAKKVWHQVLGWDTLHMSLNISGHQYPYLRNGDSIMYSMNIGVS